MSQILQFKPRSRSLGTVERRSPSLKLVAGGDQAHCRQELSAIATQVRQTLSVDAVPALFQRLKNLIETCWLEPEATIEAARLLTALRNRDLRVDDAAGLLLASLKR
ncbi:MAG: hypothetical protein AAGG11_18870 [Pseudomonadota bacterium]